VCNVAWVLVLVLAGVVGYDHWDKIKPLILALKAKLHR